MAHIPVSTVNTTNKTVIIPTSDRALVYTMQESIHHSVPPKSVQLWSAKENTVKFKIT